MNSFSLWNDNSFTQNTKRDISLLRKVQNEKMKSQMICKRDWAMHTDKVLVVIAALLNHTASQLIYRYRYICPKATRVIKLWRKIAEDLWWKGIRF